MADDRRRRRVLFTATRGAAVLLVAGLAVAGCSNSDQTQSGSTGSTTALPTNQATGEPISIGFISPEGGATSQLPESREAAEAAVKYINSNLGGLHGRPFNLVVCKEKEDPATAHDCANQLVGDHVSAVISPATGQGDAIVPTVAGAGIPYISVQGPAVSEMTTPGTFVLTSGAPGGLAVAAQYAAQHKYKKVAVVVEDAGSVMAGIKLIADPAFQQAGVELQAVPIPPGTPDTTPQLSAALAGHPDAILVLGDGPLCLSSLKALQTLGSTADKMLVQTCVSPDVVAAAGSAIDGAHVVGYADVTSDDPEAVIYRSVLAKYSPQTPVDGGAYWGYQAVLGFYRAVQGLQGDPTPAAVQTALTQAKNVPLPVGHGLTFTCDGKAQPLLKSICGKGAIVSTVSGGKATDPEAIQ